MPPLVVCRILRQFLTLDTSAARDLDYRQGCRQSPDREERFIQHLPNILNLDDVEVGRAG